LPIRKLTSAITFPRERTHEQWVEHHRRVVAILIAFGLLISYPMGVFLVAVLTASFRPAPAAPTVRPIRGSGIVVSRNDTTGTIAVQHAGVPELNIAAGTTSFRANGAVLRRTEEGDRITFDLTPVGGVYTITGTEPAPDQ
jgi:Cu/Ag efflux protein CusF